MQAHKHAAHHRPRRAAPRDTLPEPTIVDVDPEDPAQTLDEAGAFIIEDLAVGAQPASEARTDLDAATLVKEGEKGIDDEDEVEEPEEAEAVATEEHKDTGDLYGVHTQQASDTELAAPEDQDSFKDSALGGNWLEALEAKSVENGPLPEQELEVVDDSDQGHPIPHRSDTRDRPVADKGSGGRGGL